MKKKRYVHPLVCAVEMAAEGLFLGGSPGADSGPSMEIDYNSQVVEGGVKGNSSFDFDIWEKELSDF